MADNRLKKIIQWIFIAYLLLVSFWIFLSMTVGSYMYYISDGRMTNFCIKDVYVDSGEKYDYVYEEGKACVIDWGDFLIEALLFPLLVWATLTAPAFLIYMFVRKKKPSP